MRIKCLSSGSQGNSYLIDDGTTALLIEAGLSANKIINYYFDELDRIKGCLLTHEHKDHSRGIIGISNYGIDIYASQGTFNSLGKINSYRKHIIANDNQFTIGSFEIFPFETVHDCAEPLGFLIYSDVTKEKLLFVTDTNYIPVLFKDLNIIMVECNHSLQLVSENIKDYKINERIANRIVQSHFALENCIDFFKTTDLSNVSIIYLLHLSENNANAEYFKYEIQKLTRVPVYIAGNPMR